MDLLAAEFFSSLGNETRLRAMMLLLGSGELCVCDLTSALVLSQPHVSRHLGLLRKAGLVADRRAGQWVFYRVNPDLPGWAQQVLRECRQGVGGRGPFDQDALRLASAAGSKSCT